MNTPNMRDKCGTYAGWNAHQWRGEPICDACKVARKDYQRQYRLRNVTQCVRGLGWPRKADS